MKTQRTTIKLFSLLFAIAILASCSDSGSTDPESELTVEELLTSGRWYLESTTSGESYNDCDKQSYYRFMPDGELNVEYYRDLSGPCEVTQAFSVTWELISDTELLLDGYTYTIQSISEEELVWSYVISEELTVTMTLDKNPGPG